jgi:hypothetical protein
LKPERNGSKQTNYLYILTRHFTTKRNMSYNLKIGFNDNLITNSTHMSRKVVRSEGLG